MYIYLTAYLRPKSKDRGSMTCVLRFDGAATCDLRLLRSAPAPLNRGHSFADLRPAPLLRGSRYKNKKPALRAGFYAWN
jgi:hypothetical protein